jgi:hypothetical protein
MKLNFLSIIIFFIPIIGTGQKVIINNVPSWVTPVSFSSDTLLPESGSAQYLLIDKQDNIKTEEGFRQYAIKLFNAEGVQEHSDISINYDPSYQRISFHAINIIRDGKSESRLKQSEIKTIQRETDMDRALYDGSLTALVNLKDVREDDIIQYSFTIKGFNPIKEGHYSQQFYQDFGVPITRIYTRLLTPQDQNLYFKYYNSAVRAIEGIYQGMKMYTWDVEAINSAEYDNNVPGWYDVQKSVAISSYRNWNEVVNWAVPLYEDQKIPKALIEDIESSAFKDDKITACIDLIQKEVRYLGLESGIGAYMPHSPSEVYRNRYGDCKDKSLLLVSALRHYNVEAYPLLVNSTYGPDIINWLPTGTAFDHCVVQFVHEGKDYFVDPTMSTQEGSFKNRTFPDYSYGLQIKKGTRELIKIPQQEKGQINITETYKTDSLGGSGSLTISTVYKGTNADRIRSSLAQTPLTELSKNYLNYYSELYPSIESKNEIKIEESSDLDSNKIVVTEEYLIPEFWTEQEDSNIIQFELYPMVLNSDTNYPTSADRTMPYYLDNPYIFSQKTIVEMPEEWNVGSDRKSINNKYFTYTSSVSRSGKKIFTNYYYEVKDKWVEAKDYKSFQKDLEKLKGDLSFIATYDTRYDTSSGISTYSASMSLIGVFLSFFFCFYLYEDYNPPSLSEKNLEIGGWMILPLIGLVLSPIYNTYDIFNSELLDKSIYLVFEEMDGWKYIGSYAYYTLTLMLNALVIVFPIFLFILFIKKRISLPNLMIAFYIFILVYPALDFLVWNAFSSELFPVTISEIIIEQRSALTGLLIWGTYFFLSQRVKDTFVNTYK